MDANAAAHAPAQPGEAAAVAVAVARPGRGPGITIRVKTVKSPGETPPATAPAERAPVSADPPHPHDDDHDDDHGSDGVADEEAVPAVVLRRRKSAEPAPATAPVKLVQRQPSAGTLGTPDGAGAAHTAGLPRLLGSVGLGASSPTFTSLPGSPLLSRMRAGSGDRRLSVNLLEALRLNPDDGAALDEERVKDLTARRLSFVRRRSSIIDDDSPFPPAIRTRFAIREKLGSGAYADVYKVEERATGAAWALKSIVRARVHDPRRLELEITALTRAQHPAIIGLRETIHTKEYTYLVQELCVRMRARATPSDTAGVAPATRWYPHTQQHCLIMC
jgi:hypothetical protein